MQINLEDALYSRLDALSPNWRYKKQEADLLATYSFSNVLVRSIKTNNNYLIRNFDLNKGFLTAYKLSEDKVSKIKIRDLSTLLILDEDCLMQKEFDRIF